ncbi:MAG TPA: glycosyltransferase family 39 protein [Stellaceae bacterium]|nr:glycosyltransferase family 39 protein [Stellaceae bacterium]
MSEARPVAGSWQMRFKAASSARWFARTGWDDGALALFAVLLVFVLVTFKDYGVTWDEDAQNWYGVAVLNYYLSGFADRSYMHLYDLFYYGSIFDTLAAALNHVSPFGTFETRHLLNALIGIVGVVGTWKLGRVLGGPRVGFIAALFLTLTPNYYGQMFNNPKDVPFAAGMVWALYYLVCAVSQLPRPDWRLGIKLGLAAGVALAVRVGGLLIFGYIGVALLAFGLWRLAESRSLAKAIGESWSGGWRLLPVTIAIAYPVMMLFWPWAQQSPLINPVHALLYFSHEIFPYGTLFDGHYIPAADLPWEYLPTYIVLALPELVLLLLAAAPAIAFVALRRTGARHDRARVLGVFMLGFAIVFPVAYAIAIKAVLFDGMRHFIFVLPPIAVAAALAAESALGALAQRRWRRWVYGALAVYGVYHVSVMAMLHPDEYVYYNAFIGGTRGAQGLFKLDYWANSYAEDVAALENYLRAEYGNDFMDHDFTVFVCGPPASAAYYFPPNFAFTPDRANAEFVIAFTKDECNESVTGRTIYRVTRLGTLLSVVLDRRAVLAHGPRAATVVTR